MQQETETGVVPAAAPKNPETVHEDHLVSQKRLQDQKHESPAPKNPETVHKDH